MARQELRFHGDHIDYTVKHGDVPKYVVSLTWVRDETYYVEARKWSPLGAGPLVYEKGFISEDLARDGARRIVDICKQGPQGGHHGG